MVKHFAQLQCFMSNSLLYHESFPCEHLFSILTVKVFPSNVLPYTVYTICMYIYTKHTDMVIFDNNEMIR